MKKKFFLVFSVIFLLVSSGFTATGAAITAYTAVYDAETDPYFTKDNNLDSDAFVAHLGSIKVYVNRSESVFGNSDDETAFFRALYFNEMNEEANRAVLQISGSDQYVEAHLFSKISSIYQPNNLDSTSVDLYTESIVTGNTSDQYRFFLHLLPASYRTGTGSANAIKCPGNPDDTGDQWVLTVELYLKIMPSAAASQLDEDEGSQLVIDPQNSLFSSLDTLCFSHNYDPASFGGSIVPTNKLQGDLAFFPSQHFNKPIPVGHQDPGAVNCWVTFTPNNLDLDLDTIFPNAGSSSSVVSNLGTASILLYGSAFGSTTVSTNSIKYTITSKNAGNTQTDNLKLIRLRSGTTIQDTENYYSYKLTFKKSNGSKTDTSVTDEYIVSGKEYTWSGLSNGTVFSQNNVAVLSATSFDRTNATAPGLYSDTITISVTSVN